MDRYLFKAEKRKDQWIDTCLHLKHVEIPWIDTCLNLKHVKLRAKYDADIYRFGL